MSNEQIDSLKQDVDLLKKEIYELQRTMEAVLEWLRGMGGVGFLDASDRKTIADFYDRHR